MLQYGLWHQLRVDHGREFYLCLFVQSEMRNNYGPSDIEPFRQTPSTQVIFIALTSLVLIIYLYTYLFIHMYMYMYLLITD